MKILNQIRLYFVIAMLALATLTVKYLNQSQELIKCQTDKGYIEGGDIEKAELKALVDSLRDENFNKSTEVGRYEVALELLKEKNKKAAKEFELILSTQTE